MSICTVERDIMNRKIISVSKKRQITIPLHFYKHLKLGSEVECILEDGKIIIQPLHRESSEFSVEILKDLVSQGYSGNELIKQFEIQSQNIKKAVTNMLEEADAIAAGEKEAANFDDIFGSED
ncbi:MAG: AbrB/MazE/SpoVT family DNA-binding domain-containing protein [Tissierellia bacterium]|nr:AbrB/MazE/SpoVT family DNA-binding domain-containing protein [Tissierellia bacterium]NLV89787.1 AbrB/MazE/SpoVT family DNA-binding domain-containing protein [Tissierellia bacterium]